VGDRGIKRSRGGIADDGQASRQATLHQMKKEKIGAGGAIKGKLPFRCRKTKWGREWEPLLNQTPHSQ